MKKNKTVENQELRAIAQIFHSVLMVYPESNLINDFKAQNLAENWPRLTHSQREQQGIDELTYFLDKWDATDENVINLKLEYGRLFYGPETPKATPWGSTYLSPSQLLNDSSTIELKNFYKEHDIRISAESNEPIDHIGLFMAVLAYLLEKMIENPEATKYKSILVELLEKHFLPWADRCLVLAYEHAGSGYYKGFANLGLEFFDYLIQHFNLQVKIKNIYR